MIVQENPTRDLKLYSPNAIRLATFLGGPLIAGYLIRENYLALQEEKKAKQALLLGIVSTVAFFGLLFLVPTTVIDRIPNFIFPLLFTGIVSWIVEVKQGDVLRKHQEENNTFYSMWRAAGLALISAVLLFASVFMLVFVLFNF